jgi:methionine-rich copper-binding protein CopC
VKVRRVLLGAAVALGALAGTGAAAAWAHPLLISATPQPGLVADGSPKAIGLALTEPAVARGSRIRLFRPGGSVLPVTAVRASGGRRTLSVRPRARLRSAVYTVRWSALGDDGHIVSGAFRFGVAGAGGAAPRGAEQLSGAGGGRGGETAAADGAVRILSRWLGILSASILFGGFVLLALLRRRGGAADGAAAVLRRLAPAAWVLVAVAAVEGIVAGARAGAGGSLDLGLLTASATGISELARGAVVVALALALALTRGRPALRDRIHAGGGAAVLLTYAL